MRGGIKAVVLASAENPDSGYGNLISNWLYCSVEDPDSAIRYRIGYIVVWRIRPKPSLRRNRNMVHPTFKERPMIGRGGSRIVLNLVLLLD